MIRVDAAEINGSDLFFGFGAGLREQQDLREHTTARSS